jgi:putative NADH-flavin reductase
MRVAIFGAAGNTGKHVVEVALERGHDVTAFVRRPEALAAGRERLRVIQGDALDAGAVDRAVAGQDAVIQALGLGGKGDGKPSSLVSDATRILIGAMERAGVRRLVCMSNIGAGDSYGEMPVLFRGLLMPLFFRWLRPILVDKNRMEPLVTASQLDWTLVRLPAIVDQPARGRRRVAASAREVGFRITAGDTAELLVEQLDDATWVRRIMCASN